jgi:hypothetical protein
MLSADLHKREALYGEFVTECSKLMLDSLDHTLEHPATILNAVAILNRIRLMASPPVLGAAEAVLQVIVQNYVREKMTIDDLRARLRAGTLEVPDPLADFSRSCRTELQQVQRAF